jgi:flagellar hook-length control protein FliK
MIVQNFVQSPTPEGPAKTQSKGDGGNAFGRAMRDAADGKPVARDRAAASGSDAGSRSAATKDAAAKPTDAAGAAAGEPSNTADEPNKETDKPEDALRGLLGLLAPQHKIAKTAATPGETEGERTPSKTDARGQDLGDLGEGEMLSEKETRLKVLRMETHFEPGQEGMVVVDGASGSTPRLERFDLAGKAAAAKTGRHPAETETETVALPDTATTPGSQSQSEGEPQGSVRIGFGEAVARLGRGETGSDRSKGDSNRNASSGRMVPVTSAKQDDGRAGTINSTSTTGSGAIVPTMTMQIADTIIEALGQPASEAGRAPGAATAETHVRMRAGGAALKTLTIQLQPEHLGTLEVSMRLVDDKLTLELSASRDDTAVALMNDREGLRKLLEHAGFSLDDTAIRIAVKDQVTAKASDGAGANPGQSRPDGQAAGGGSAKEGRSGASNGERERPLPARMADDAAPGARRSGSTYL